MDLGLECIAARVAVLDESENCFRRLGNSADQMIQTVAAEGMVAHQMPDNQAV